ncbi:MAG: SDR family oxidoreductase [Hylemonella sp.]
MDLNLAKQRVLITGSSKGIGFEIAKTFAQEGALPILVSRDSARLQQAAADIRSSTGVPCEYIAKDVSVTGAAEALLEQVGQVDILVNNAGAIPGGNVYQVDEQTWRSAWDLKVFGFINMTRSFLKPMEERGYGVILNIIGQAGSAPRWDYICGSTGNASLMAFTQAVGGNSTKSGVRVFGINPAPTRSDRMEGLLRRQAKIRFDDESRWHELTEQLAFGRLIEPPEIARLAVFCASPLCSYLSGTVIDVDGGMLYAPPRY